MLDNLYTTKMSANTKSLQNRFAKIRQKSGRASKIMAFVMAVTLALAALCATVVMAAVDGPERDVQTIEFTSDGKKITFKNAPFIQYGAVYLPLRELFEKVGVMEQAGSEILWDNGRISICVATGTDDFHHFGLEIGKNALHIGHGTPVSDNAVVAMLSLNQEHVPLLKDGITYVTYDYIDYMLDRGINQSGGYQFTCIASPRNNELFAVWENLRPSPVADDWNLSMTAREVTPTGLTLVFRDDEQNLTKINYAGAYTLEQYADGSWKPVPEIAPAEEPLVTTLTVEGGSFQTRVNWNTHYGELPPGIYRISKELRKHSSYEEYESKIFYAEFVITSFKAHITPYLIWPCESDVISHSFGTRTHPFTGETRTHNGIDIVAEEGADVHAATGGTVTETGFDAEKGNYIILTHNNITTLYAQLSAIHVAEGDTVTRRDIIGSVGKTGTATGPHLHFEIMIDGVHYNPELIY